MRHHRAAAGTGSAVRRGSPKAAPPPGPRGGGGVSKVAQEAVAEGLDGLETGDAERRHEKHRGIPMEVRWEGAPAAADGLEAAALRSVAPDVQRGGESPSPPVHLFAMVARNPLASSSAFRVFVGISCGLVAASATGGGNARVREYRASTILRAANPPRVLILAPTTERAVKVRLQTLACALSYMLVFAVPVYLYENWEYGCMSLSSPADLL